MSCPFRNHIFFSRKRTYQAGMALAPTESPAKVGARALLGRMGLALTVPPSVVCVFAQLLQAAGLQRKGLASTWEGDTHGWDGQRKIITGPLETKGSCRPCIRRVISPIFLHVPRPLCSWHC